MITENMSYRESLLSWGDSGSFYPNLIPRTVDETNLREFQQELLQISPEATPVDNLHLTLLYFSPKRLYEYLLENSSVEFDKAMLYMDLNTLFSSLLLSRIDREDMTLDVDSIDLFGADNSTVVLKLNSTPGVEYFSKYLKAQTKNILSIYGLSDSEFETMTESSEFRWLLSESQHHLSLISKVSALAVFEAVRLPETVTFDRIHCGSMVVPSDHPEAWYLGLDSVSEEDL
jgi:hypothetical protein